MLARSKKLIGNTCHMLTRHRITLDENAFVRSATYNKFGYAPLSAHEPVPQSARSQGCPRSHAPSHSTSGLAPARSIKPDTVDDQLHIIHTRRRMQSQHRRRTWQKYNPANSSCRRMICAPCACASRTNASAFLRFSSVSKLRDTKHALLDANLELVFES